MKAKLVEDFKHMPPKSPEELSKNFTADQKAIFYKIKPVKPELISRIAKLAANYNIDKKSLIVDDNEDDGSYDVGFIFKNNYYGIGITKEDLNSKYILNFWPKYEDGRFPITDMFETKTIDEAEDMLVSWITYAVENEEL